MTREYAVNIMGVRVCEGRVEYVAEKLDVAHGTVFNYATKAPAGIEIIRLSGLYDVPGSRSPLTEEQACNVLLCDIDDFKRSAYRKAHGVKRVWRKQWSLPVDDIKELRIACDRRKVTPQRRLERGEKDSDAPVSYDMLFMKLELANNRIDALESQMEALMGSTLTVRSSSR